jgi:predicted nucleic-acid-binding Zn-ribbon protein
MKTLKFLLFVVLALSMGVTCSEDNTVEQKPDDSQGQDLLKGKLTGEWVVSGQKNSFIYTFADNDTVYIKTQEGDTPDKWPYQTIAADSIRIVRNWTTHNKVVFYSNDSIRISDFIPSLAAVYPPMFGDAVLKRYLNDEMKLTGTQWKLFGIFDVQNNSLKVLNPLDCEECYTLNFDTDSTATGKSSTNLVWVDLSGKEKLIGIATEKGERGDGYLFCDAVESVTSYSCNGNELKFFYNDDSYYLLYYRIFDGMESGFVDTNELSGTGYVFADSVPTELQNKKNIMYIIYNKTTHSANFSAVYPEAFYNGDILNFSEFTKGWEIPVEGIQINYAGILYQLGIYWSMPPRIGGYLVLTSF